MGTIQTSSCFNGFRPTLLVISCLATAGLVACGSTPEVLIPDAGPDAGSDAGQDAGPPPVIPITLVEVFGSEGCGKCPKVEIAVNPFATQASSGIYSIEY